MNAPSFRFYAATAPYSQRQLADAADRLAELLAQGFELNDCADRMGVTGGTACVLFARICARLGERPQ